MDPSKALRDLLQAMKDGNRDEAEEAAKNLFVWLSKDGFMPSPGELAAICEEFAR